MSWVSQALDAIARGETVRVRPHGGSMRGRIESGQSVLLQPCSFEQVQVGDVVFTRWKGNYLLHLVVELGKNDALIGNTLGKTNGWVSREDILAVVREVTD